MCFSAVKPYYNFILVIISPHIILFSALAEYQP
jgi:hypothetical protein